MAVGMAVRIWTGATQTLNPLGIQQGIQQGIQHSNFKPYMITISGSWKQYAWCLWQLEAVHVVFMAVGSSTRGVCGSWKQYTWCARQLEAVRLVCVAVGEQCREAVRVVYVAGFRPQSVVT